MPSTGPGHESGVAARRAIGIRRGMRYGNSLRIPVKVISDSGLNVISDSGQSDHRSERSDAGVGDSVARLADRMRESVDEAVRRAGNGAAATFAADLSGWARVIDGDTIEVGGARVRLHGVDAPESGQSCLANGQRWPCGQRATRALDRHIGGRSVACEERDRDRYGRVVAVCRHAGRDVNAWLVAQGWALAYRRYSGAYVDGEEAARAARRGVWRGEFVVPWDWRRGERLGTRNRGTPRTDKDTRGGCNIKGNISYNSGRRIYHMPGERGYARTRINPSRGERWFCSEAEARAAGWRRAGR